jgi:hypothetical protein
MMVTAVLSVVAVLTLEVGEKTRTRMNLNGHAVAHEWQTACANAGEDFTDNSPFINTRTWV